MLRYQCTTHLCQTASGKNSAALSESPMHASEMISRTPCRPRSLRCLRKPLQPVLSSLAPSQMLAEAALSGAVHRVPGPVDHKLSEKDLSRGRRIARTQGQVGASLRAAVERPPPTVLSRAVLAGNQSGRIGLERRCCDCCKKIHAKFARSSRWKRRVMQPHSS